jgi:septal ring factor EnvC (AmiA/AmiB activator)
VGWRLSSRRSATSERIPLPTTVTVFVHLLLTVCICVHRLAVAQTKILGLQERIEDQKSTEQLLSTKLEGNSDRYLALQDRIEELMDKLSRSDSATQNYQRQNEQLKAQLGDALNASCRTKDEHSRDRGHYDELMKEKLALEETIVCLEEDLRGSSDRYKSLQALFDKGVAE